MQPADQPRVGCSFLSRLVQAKRNSTRNPSFSRMAMMPSKVLPSGARIPSLGLGVYKCRKGRETYESVRSALELGYRHIDTAAWYRNEQDVGRAMADSGIARDQLFVTTKLWVAQWGYTKATAAVIESTKKLGVSYIDLLLLHAPGDRDTRAETWRALEDLQMQGVVRDIGVSNFGPAHLDKLSETARVRPAVNQIELHPWMARKELVAYCRVRGIQVEAYSPLAKATMLSHPVLRVIAKDINATPAQVLIAYSLAKDYVTIPKSVHRERQEENLRAVELKLSAAQVAELDALDEYRVTAWDPIKLHEV